MEFLYKEYGEKLKNIRKDQKYTQKEVSNLIGIGTDTLWRLENGLVEPTIHNLSKLSKLYKLDLLELLTRFRKPSSLLSQDMIVRTNTAIALSDLDKLNEEIEDIKADLKEDSDNFEYIENATELMTIYLDALKNISTYGMKDKTTITQQLEASLQAVSKSKNMLSDSILYEFEISMAIFLSIVYRRNDQHSRSLEILNALEKNLKNKDYPPVTQNKYLSTVYYNMCVTHHRMNEHKLVIEAANRALDNMDTFANRRLLFLILFRKGIAMYFLEDDHYPCLLYTVLCHSDEENLKHFTNAIFDIHKIDHPLLLEFKK